MLHSFSQFYQIESINYREVQIKFTKVIKSEAIGKKVGRAEREITRLKRRVEYSTADK